MRPLADIESAIEAAGANPDPQAGASALLALAEEVLEEGRHLGDRKLLHEGPVGHRRHAGLGTGVVEEAAAGQGHAVQDPGALLGILQGRRFIAEQHLWLPGQGHGQDQGGQAGQVAIHSSICQSAAPGNC